jgi:hypothetical protein
MTLAELERQEKVALLALLGLMARLDGQVEGDELELLRRVVSEIGGDDFERLAREAASYPDADAILQTAEKVTRPEAREVIYELLFDMAVREGIAERENELLMRLAASWGLPSPVSA